MLLYLQHNLRLTGGACDDCARLPTLKKAAKGQPTRLDVARVQGQPCLQLFKSSTPSLVSSAHFAGRRPARVLQQLVLGVSFYVLLGKGSIQRTPQPPVHAGVFQQTIQSAVRGGGGLKLS